MTCRRGFSLLEITLVIFIMGLTITALLQMFEWSHMRYREISRGWQQRAGMAEIRVWLRDKVIAAETGSLNATNLNQAVKLPAGYFVNDLKLTQHDPETWFIRLDLCEDRNRNGLADNTETTPRLFCFRRRST
ncbi:MAG: prepilin-type N-terminal cleavage/methylation domain-containing protein [Candidatus Riflebacteria bacterium]|jgi:prepilin-type N-terminal cleavage/methylation domain-containing protein|nr:prepilin-type N-terminal cleavage/methylation domain-containing protein [Candidatus Riflebacteria bacterium]